LVGKLQLDIYSKAFACARSVFCLLRKWLQAQPAGDKPTQLQPEPNGGLKIN
jgi:hypothetical protein